MFDRHARDLAPVKDGTVLLTNSCFGLHIITLNRNTTRILSVLAYVAQKWGVGTANEKNIALEIQGLCAPQWSPCNAINPEAEGVVIPRASKAKASTQLVLQGALVSESEVPTAAIEKTTALATEPTPPISEESHAESAQAIAPSKQQRGAAEKNVAKLLEQAGLSFVITQGEDFHLRIENEPYIPLVIERHGNSLYLTHYLEQGGDTFIDSEMVFRIKEGQLAFQETAVQNPLTGGESRAADRGFARTFSSNLLHQGFAEAARNCNQQQEKT